MKSLATIYKNGQFYLKDGDKLVTFINNTEVILIVEQESNLLIEDLKPDQLYPLNEIPKQSQVKLGSNRHAKIFSAGTSLFFDIKINKQKHLATAVLLEDLYLFEKDTWINEEAALFKCVCQMISIQGLDVKEPITAPSLSDLYKHVYVHYNGNNGSPSANAFTTFFTSPQSRQTLDSVRESTKLVNS